jgi:hypothetical protein
LNEETDIIEANEKANRTSFKHTHQLNNLSKHRAKDVARIPKMFESVSQVTATKKVVMEYRQNEDKLQMQLPHIANDPSSCYFVEIHDELLTNYRYFNEFDEDINEINRELITQEKD